MMWWGVFDLLGITLVALAKWLRRGSMVVLLIVLFAPHAHAAQREVHEECFTRIQYQVGADYTSTWWGSKLWRMRLCQDFEFTYKTDDAITVALVGEARLQFSTYPPYGPSWSAEECTTWRVPEDNKFAIRGACKVNFYTPFVKFGAWSSKYIHTGFTRSGSNVDYLYPTAVDYWREDDGKPLPME
jgi:hypothetical protein